jgi:hypothetical protein
VLRCTSYLVACVSRLLCSPDVQCTAAVPRQRLCTWRFRKHECPFACPSPLYSLVSGTVDVNSRDMLGRTALHVATLGGRTSAVTLLIEEGARVSARLTDGRTALHIAAVCVHLSSGHAPPPEFVCGLFLSFCGPDASPPPSVWGLPFTVPGTTCAASRRRCLAGARRMRRRRLWPRQPRPPVAMVSCLLPALATQSEPSDSEGCR